MLTEVYNNLHDKIRHDYRMVMDAGSISIIHGKQEIVKISHVDDRYYIIHTGEAEPRMIASVQEPEDIESYLSYFLDEQNGSS